MSIELTTKFSPQTDELFKAESKISLLTNTDFDWTGAHSIKLYKISTTPLNDYARNAVASGQQIHYYGANGSELEAYPDSAETLSRYGKLLDLSATTEELLLKHDRSFIFNVDKLDQDETQQQLEAGTALARELRREMIFIPDDELDEFISSCCRRLRQNNAEELYAAIGYGGMTIANCLPKLKEEWQKLKAAEAAENKSVEDLPKVDLSRVHATDGVVVEGFDNTPIKFAKCCSPLPGDPIVGFITRGFGVSIHKQSCANAMSSMKDPSNAPRWVKAYWADSVKDSYKAGLEIIALNRNELLSDVLAALADIRVPIYAMNARQVENNCAVISLTIGINNTEHLNRVVARLSKVKDVLKVTRS